MALAWALFLPFLLLLTACDEEKSPTEPRDPVHSIMKSAKRGLSYDLRLAADLDTLKSGVSWWYNWYYETNAPENYYDDYEMEFIPMLWGANPSANQMAQTASFILDHPEIEYLLVMNEPNLVDQANRTPVQAAQDWLLYEQFVSNLADQGREVKLVGPAMNWGTMNHFGDPVVWLDAFYTEFQTSQGRDPQIDYLAFHWYDYGLASQLDRLQKYGKQIWITELANWNSNIDSYTEQVVQMVEMVALCESREDVFRYAWFIGRGGLPDNHFTYLFHPDAGELTDLGEVYIHLPY